MTQTVLGFLLGIVSSGIIWWSTVRMIRPRLTFGKGIRKKPSIATPGYIYSLRIMNRGLRAAVDVETRVTLKYDHPLGVSEFRQLLTLEHYNKRTWSIRGRTASEFFRRKPYGGNRIFQVLPNETDEFLRRRHMPPRIHEGVRNQDLRLEEVLELLPNACIQVAVMALDNFSGARRLFLSQEFTVDDIVLGEWKGAELEPAPAEPVEPVAQEVVNSSGRDV